MGKETKGSDQGAGWVMPEATKTVDYLPKGARTLIEAKTVLDRPIALENARTEMGDSNEGIADSEDGAEAVFEDFVESSTPDVLPGLQRAPSMLLERFASRPDDRFHTANAGEIARLKREAGILVKETPPVTRESAPTVNVSEAPAIISPVAKASVPKAKPKSFFQNLASAPRDAWKMLQGKPPEYSPAPVKMPESLDSRVEHRQPVSNSLQTPENPMARLQRENAQLDRDRANLFMSGKMDRFGVIMNDDREELKALGYTDAQLEKLSQLQGHLYEEGAA